MLVQSPSPSGPAQTCVLFPEATSRHNASFGNMNIQENWRRFSQKPVHKKLLIKSIAKHYIKSIAVIASITVGSQLSAEALPSRADAWNYGECNSGTFLYVKGNSWYSFSRGDGWLYGGVAKKFNQYIVIQNQNIVLYPKKYVSGCMDFILRSQHGFFE